MTSFQVNDTIYQVFVGRWQDYDISKFPNQVIKQMTHIDWQSHHKVGFTWIYLLGLFDNQGDIIVDHEEGINLNSNMHRLPSPFALTHHDQVNPQLGTNQELADFITILHQANLKVMVDFVPNHTGLNHSWIKTNPDFYVWENNQLVKEFSGDVAKLNYFNLELRRQMIQILINLCQLGVDGFRCDMAHMVPADFWQEAIISIKQLYPEVIFCAEAYADNPFNTQILSSLLEAGFDAIYDELLYRNLNSVISNNSPITYVLDHLHYKHSVPKRYVHFASNHDDAVPGSHQFLPAITMLMIVLPGPLLVYNGFLNKFDRRLAHHYLDLLPNKYQSTIFPQWVSRLLQSRNNKAIYIKSITENLSLFKIDLEINNCNCRLFLNFTHNPVNLSVESNHIQYSQRYTNNIISSGGFVLTSESKL